MTPNKKMGRPRNPKWQTIPHGARLTLSEVAAHLGIARETLRSNYCKTGGGPRSLPEGFSVVRDQRTILIVRA